MKVYEAIARALGREGVTTMFGLMGDGNLKLIPTMVEHEGVSWYGARHEGSAVAMAEGYAKVGGHVGVATFTQGPGLTNAITALVSAHRNRTPMVALVGDTPSGVPGLVQDIEQGPILDSAGIAWERITARTAIQVVADAFTRARVDRCPVAVIMPTDVQDEECEWAEPVAQPAAADHVESDEEQILAAARAIAAAERVVVIAGRGSVLDGAREPIIRLADRLGALLATSLQAKGWFGDHPYALGIAGGFASDVGFRLIREADCIVVFGASLNHFTSRGGRLFGHDATIVQVDVDAEAFGRFTRTDVAVRGSASAVADELTKSLEPRSGYRSEDTAEQIADQRRRTFDPGDRGAIDPRALSATLDAILPSERNLVVDGGHFVGFPSQHIHVAEPSRFLFTLGFGSIGLGLPAAIGAAAAHPDRLTVAAVGDGGLMMSLGELDTAVRAGLPLLVVVYNDAAYGAELHFLQILGLRDDESRFDSRPISEIARAVGMEAIAVETLDDLQDVVPRLQGRDGPLLLDCQIAEDVRADWIAEAFERTVA